MAALVADYVSGRFLVVFLVCNSRCAPFTCRQDRLQVLTPLVLLVTMHFALCSLLLSTGPLPGVSCPRLSSSRQWPSFAGFAGYVTSRCVPVCCCAQHHGRYGPEGQFAARLRQACGARHHGSHSANSGETGEIPGFRCSSWVRVLTRPSLQRGRSPCYVGCAGFQGQVVRQSCSQSCSSLRKSLRSQRLCRFLRCRL